MTDLYIVRHGNTFSKGEPSRRIGARTDLPLVESGCDQGRRLGAWFKARSINFDKVLVGPLSRSRNTAGLILAEQQPEVDIEQVDWLDEVDHGPDENRLEEEVLQRIGPAALTAWDRDAIAPADWTVDTDARILAWQRLFAAGRVDRTRKTVLLVTSNGAARFALLADPQMQREVIVNRSLKLRTGAWGLIRIAPMETRLVSWDERPSKED